MEKLINIPPGESTRVGYAVKQRSDNIAERFRPDAAKIADVLFETARVFSNRKTQICASSKECAQAQFLVIGTLGSEFSISLLKFSTFLLIVSLISPTDTGLSAHTS